MVDRHGTLSARFIRWRLVCDWWSASCRNGSCVGLMPLAAQCLAEVIFCLNLSLHSLLWTDQDSRHSLTSGGCLRCLFMAACSTVSANVCVTVTLQIENVRGFDTAGLPLFSDDGVRLGPGLEYPPVNEYGNPTLTDQWWTDQVLARVVIFVC